MYTLPQNNWQSGGFVWRPEATDGRLLSHSFRTTLLRNKDFGICWINVSSPAFAVFYVLEFMVHNDVAGNLFVYVC